MAQSKTREAFDLFILPTVLRHEGGLVDDPDDSGGITNFGISLRYLQGLPKWVGDVNDDGTVDAADVRGMTPDQAADIYYREFHEAGYARWLDLNGAPGIVLAQKLFDTRVNTGPHRSAVILQRAVACCGALGTPLADDGVIGPLTRKAVKRAADDHPSAMVLLAAFRAEQAAFYRAIATGRRRKFLAGWLRRAWS